MLVSMHGCTLPPPSPPPAGVCSRQVVFVTDSTVHASVCIHQEVYVGTSHTMESPDVKTLT